MSEVNEVDVVVLVETVVEVLDPLEPEPLEPEPELELPELELPEPELELPELADAIPGRASMVATAMTPPAAMRIVRHRQPSSVGFSVITHSRPWFVALDGGFATSSTRSRRPVTDRGSQLVSCCEDNRVLGGHFFMGQTAHPRG
jgi:hypothetical protein